MIQSNLLFYFRFIFLFCFMMLVRNSMASEIKNMPISVAQAKNLSQEKIGNCPASESALEDLKRTYEAYAQRKKELDQKEAELKSKEDAIADQIKTLEQLRNSIAEIKTARQHEDTKKITRLVETVLTMSPKSAAKLLTSLEDKLAVQVISEMDTSRLAQVMNVMDPTRSSYLSELMAGATVVGVARNEKKHE